MVNLFKGSRISGHMYETILQMSTTDQKQASCRMESLKDTENASFFNVAKNQSTCIQESL